MENAARHFYAMESRLTAGVSERMLDLAGLRAGMRVLDLASGRGEPLLRAAERVGPARAPRESSHLRRLRVRLSTPAKSAIVILTHHAARRIGPIPVIRRQR
jgi:hypothetical protein